MKFLSALFSITIIILFIQCNVQKVIQTEKATMEDNIEVKEEIQDAVTKEPQKTDAPVALKKDTLLKMHGDTRSDPYYWMRLTDEQKNAKTPDKQTQQVLDYLNAENKYTKTNMQATEELQKKLFDEIVGRIKKDDESVPYFK